MYKRSQRILLSSSGTSRYYNGLNYSDVEFVVPFVKKEENTFTTVSFLSCVFPASYYNVEYYQNILYLQISDVIHTITITPGNYTYATFQTELRRLLPSSVTVSYNIQTGMFTFYCNEMIKVLSATTCYLALGFPKNTAVEAVLDGTSYVLLFPLTANFLGPLKFIIQSNTLSFENWNCSDNNQYMVDVNVTSGPYGITVYEQTNPTEVLMQDNHVPSIIRISIKDEQGNFINFRGVHWYITMLIHTHFRRYPWAQTMPNFLEKGGQHRRGKRRRRQEEEDIEEEGEGQDEDIEEGEENVAEEDYGEEEEEEVAEDAQDIGDDGERELNATINDLSLQYADIDEATFLVDESKKMQLG